MHRNGSKVFALSLIGLLLVTAGGAAAKTDVEKLEKLIETLGTQVKALDTQVKALEMRLKAIEPKTVPAVIPNAEEGAAQALLAEVPRLADSGDYEQAKTKLAELKSKYGSTKAAGTVAYYTRELEVFGKDSPSDWGIEKWFQGEKEIDLAGKKPTVVVFWEEWCPHCRDEMPKMQQLFETHKGQGLQILGVTRLTQGATEEKVRAFITLNKVQYPIAKEDGKLTSYFNVGGIPAVAVVKDGKVIWRGHPARISDEMIKRWLS